MTTMTIEQLKERIDKLENNILRCSNQIESLTNERAIARSQVDYFTRELNKLYTEEMEAKAA